MDANAALELAERLVQAQTGKYLSDLERTVFIGSWNHQTYATIYPANPEYIEKDVGYKLWQKLSLVFGEKVTKKKLQGALERALQRLERAGQLVARPDHQSPDDGSAPVVASGLPDGGGQDAPPAATQPRPQLVLISHRNQEPDASLAQQLYAAIGATGHQAQFTATDRATRLNQPDLVPTDWLRPINTLLQECDYFLLLLSPQAAVSEMVIEELHHVTARPLGAISQPPVLLPIWVNCPAGMVLNHELQAYLQHTCPLQWLTSSDTPGLVQRVLDCLNRQLDWSGKLLECSPIGSAPLVARPASAIPRPSPVADPEIPQGQVRLDSPFYIDRHPYEAQCYREILQPGTLIRIKAPRQMGKTSLMSRILYQAREQGYRTVPLTFQHADAGVFASLNQFLQWFCSKITRKLRLPHQIEQYWPDTYGSKDNCTAYFEDYLLSAIDSPLVLGLDEVDRIFQYPKIADDFFGLLRAWYEEAGYGDSDSGLWQKLRLIVVHSTEVYIPLDVNQSPFNVGLPIELTEFNPAQVLDLAQRHHLNWQDADVDQLMQSVGGHPYLIRLALYHLAHQHLTLAQLTDLAPTEAGIYGDHLRRHLWNLQQHPELAIAWSAVITQPNPVELDSVLAFKLHSLGLVNLHGNYVSPRFELYRRYFSERLAHLSFEF